MSLIMRTKKVNIIHGGQFTHSLYQLVVELKYHHSASFDTGTFEVTGIYPLVLIGGNTRVIKDDQFREVLRGIIIKNPYNLQVYFVRDLNKGLITIKTLRK